MKSILYKCGVSVVALIIALSPLLVLAQANNDSGVMPSLIVCGGKSQVLDNVSYGEECTFTHLIAFGKAIINLIFYLSVPVALLSFMYVGWLYLSAAGDEGKVKKAKDIFWNVLLGFVFIFAAWLIVHTIVAPFLNKSAGYKEFSF